MVSVNSGVRSISMLNDVIITPVASGLAPVALELIAPAVLAPRNATWDEVARPRKQSFLEWTGYSVQRQSFSCIFAGQLDGLELRDITSETVKLHNLASPPGGDTEPAVCRISGPLYGIGANDRWQIESITPGPPWRRESDGRVCQVTYEVTLVQWLSSRDVVTAANVVSPAAAAAARQGNPAAKPARTYTVRSGDSLSRIAARELGNANRWPEIASLNGVSNPNRISIGQVLKLP